ncbi:MAG: NINE protein [Terracidiphilus sp.]|jgi:TM2 domain-containing membrane protein YozV
MQEQPVEQELSWSQQRALDDAYDRNKKSMVKAYVLAVLFGGLGIHRLYLDRPRTGYLMFGICIVSFFIRAWGSSGYQQSDGDILCEYIGYLMMFALWIWIVVDLFLIPKMLRKFNTSLAAQLRKGISEGTMV